MMCEHGHHDLLGHMGPAQQAGAEARAAGYAPIQALQDVLVQAASCCHWVHAEGDAEVSDGCASCGEGDACSFVWACEMPQVANAHPCGLGLLQSDLGSKGHVSLFTAITKGAYGSKRRALMLQ